MLRVATCLQTNRCISRMTTDSNTGLGVFERGMPVASKSVIKKRAFVDLGLFHCVHSTNYSTDFHRGPTIYRNPAAKQDVPKNIYPPPTDLKGDLKSILQVILPITGSKHGSQTAAACIVSIYIHRHAGWSFNSNILLDNGAHELNNENHSFVINNRVPDQSPRQNLTAILKQNNSLEQEQLVYKDSAKKLPVFRRAIVVCSRGASQLYNQTRT